MKILLVVAMPNHLKAVKEGIKSANLKENMDIDYLCSGIGNYEVISSLEHYLTKNPEPTFILNIGICGCWNFNNGKKSNLIQLSSIVNIHTKKEMIIPPFIHVAPLKRCFSCENLVFYGSELGKQIGGVIDEIYFDMESWGVEFIASKYKFPRLILKIPFDCVCENNEFEEKINGEFSEKIGEMLRNLPYYDYLGKILVWIKYQEFI